MCPLNDKWINEIWYVDTMEYYSAIYKNELQIHAPTWMNPGKSMLSARSQA